MSKEVKKCPECDKNITFNFGKGAQTAATCSGCGTKWTLKKGNSPKRA